MATGESRRRALDRFLGQLDAAPLISLPMCIYIVDAKGELVFCNPETRALLGLPPEGDVHARITDYHAEEGMHERLVASAVDADPGSAAGGPNGGRKTVVHLDVAGREVYVEHYISASPSDESEGDGLFVGCMVDITEDHLAAQRTEALQKTVREMTFDIGQILHANTSTLVMVNQTLIASARAMEPELDADSEASRPEALEELMAQRAAKLAGSLARLVTAGDDERRAAALPVDRWEKLAGLIEAIEGHRENIPVPEMRVSALRTLTGEVLAACRAMEPGHMPREAVRDTLRAAADLERLTCFIDILATRTAVIQMDTSLAALRDFITTEIRADDPNARITVASIVRESIAHLAEFARAARVEIVWRNRSEDIEVFGNRRDLLRAVTNVLHNAVKYSWKREGYDDPWIAIEVSEEDGVVAIEVENWGVPIESGELEAGLIFGLGYRGKRSKDRGRLGTGIGLTDSRRVALAHGGDLTVTSRPARASSPDPGDRGYYRQPFLTKVRMTLPRRP